jgi:hypothetical protein
LQRTVDPAGVYPQVELRDQLDFDSTDVFGFAPLIHETFGVDVPGRD